VVDRNSVLVGVCINLFFSVSPEPIAELRTAACRLPLGGLFVRSDWHVVFLFRVRLNRGVATYST
jgi:hypothetical protein